MKRYPIAGALLLALALGAYAVVSAHANTARPSGVIAFVRSHGQAREIWRANTDGSGLRRLTSNVRGGDEHPAWSPDGARIAFARSIDGGKSIRIYVMNANGHGLRLVSPKGGTFAGGPDWSPDGRWIAFTGGGGTFGNCRGDAFLVHPNGTGFHRIVRGAPIVFSPAWSPDGKRLAITRADRNDRNWILVGRADGRHMRRLTAGSQPSWSPDGQRIAFNRDTRTANRIFLIGANGRGLRQVTPGNQFELDPAWSPDGQWIAYWSARGGHQNIYARPATGGKPLYLTHAPANSGDEDPAWAPNAG